MIVTDLKTALSTVEEDHCLVLEKLQALKDTVSCLLEPGDIDTQRVLGHLLEINEYFATHFMSHVGKEEATLFPFLEQQEPEGPDLVLRLRLEHEAIRRKREEFGNCLQIAGEVGEGPTRMVLRDLLAYGWELWELLDNHAHVETQAVHRCIARYLQT